MMPGQGKMHIKIIKRRDRAPLLRKGQCMRLLQHRMEDPSVKGAAFIKMFDRYCDLAGFQPPKRTKPLSKATESEAEMIVRMEEERKQITQTTEDFHGTVLKNCAGAFLPHGELKRG